MNKRSVNLYTCAEWFCIFLIFGSMFLGILFLALPGLVIGASTYYILIKTMKIKHSWSLFLAVMILFAILSGATIIILREYDVLNFPDLMFTI